MGLDMYLNARRYLFTGGMKPADDELAKKIAELVGVTTHEVKQIELRAAYWRKANAIHAWFVKSVQGGEDECREHDVSRERLTELRDLCQLVLDARATMPQAEWRGFAHAELPTQDGFFFGGTDYDDDYLEDLRDTINQINSALVLPDGFVGGWTFSYQSSW